VRLAALLGRGGRAREAQLAHALRAVPVFAELPRADLLAVWRRLHELRLPAGAVVFERGDPGDRFYVLQSGTVELCLGLGPEAVPIRRLGPGDALGEMALVTGDPRSADAVVQEDAVFWVLDGDAFAALTARSVPLLRALTRDLCRRLRLATLQIEDLDEQLGGTGAAVAGMRVGPYRVVQQLGSGGMAVVFSAVHAATERTVALKVLPAAWGEAPELRARLEREAAALQRLDHPNVVRVLDVGRVAARAGGGCYLAMEWLPQALDRVLRAQFPEPLPPAAALGLAAGVADGLAAVHALGLVHRDVKPSNILLRADGTPVLTDFGLALARDAAAGTQRLTAPNVVLGTADYLAPEQIRGDDPDGRADLYALGVVLYELLAGHVPFAGTEPPQTLEAHLREEPPPLPQEVPPGARGVVARALRKAPADRFPTAAEMAAACRAALP
jgi:CRP-like cAMP-binding protein